MQTKTGRSLFSTVLLIFLAATTLAACVSALPSKRKIPKVVFVIVDGIPADVLENTSTPHLDEISAEGGYTRAYVGGVIGAETESPTISAVGYMSLLTGTWANKHRVFDNAVENPDYGYWDIFRIAKSQNPALQTALFSTWQDNRTKLLGDGLAEAGGSKLDYYYDGFELDTYRFPHDSHGQYLREIDTIVVDEAADYIRRQGPDLTWIYLEQTDDVAHRYGDSPEFYAAVRLMDSQMGQLWKAIRERRATHNEDWLLLITTDHGRDPVTGKDHGEQSARERTTWIVTNSDQLLPSFFEGPGIVDILPSLATHLDLTIPQTVRLQLDGRSFIE